MADTPLITTPAAPVSGTDPSSTLPPVLQQTQHFLATLTPESLVQLCWQILPGLLGGLLVATLIIYGRRWLLRYLNKPSLAVHQTTGLAADPADVPPVQSVWRLWLVSALHAIRPWYIAFIAVASAVSLMPLNHGFLQVVHLLAGLLTVIQLGLLLNQLTQRFAASYLARYPDDGMRATTVSSLQLIASILIWALLALVALANLGFNVNAIIAGLGIGGVAVAFASQNILQSIFASLATVFDSPIALGDYITTKETSGTVEKIGLKTTTIRSLSGEQVLIANNDLFGNRISNFGRMHARRMVLGFLLFPDTPPHLAGQVPTMVEDIIKQQPNARFERCHLSLVSTDVDRLKIEAVYHVQGNKLAPALAVQQAIILAVMQRLPAAGIGLGFATKTL